ncbi:MAG: S-methyl-5'-thioadenosine phosphorylase [Methanobrevibacter sp.]|jgi:5'-methylthioadenosine phosphorylase|nr:S-methyl-5'-thioadenosine phosphorylase [Candidatus Methanovirga basalitermitum]
MTKKIGIIGGSGIYSIVDRENSEKKTVNTPYGDSADVFLFKINDKDVVFLPRHKIGHKLPPSMINYRANIFALKELGVNQIIATNSVGSLKKDNPPGSLILPDDFIDFTYMRDKTFYDKEVVHTDFSQPYCNRLRDIISKNGDLVNKGVYVCSEGPRFETGAEVRMFQKLGGDIVGMTGLPEVVLAREKKICYSSLSIVTNYSTSLSEDKLTMKELFEMMEVKKEEVIEIILSSIKDTPLDYECDCLI